MDTFETLGNDGAYALQRRSFRSPVARRTGAIFLTRQNHKGHAFRLILYGRVEDRHLFIARQMTGVTAFAIWNHLVTNTCIGEGSAHHYFVVATARSVRVEIARLHAVCDQIPAGR